LRHGDRHPYGLGIGQRCLERWQAPARAGGVDPQPSLRRDKTRQGWMSFAHLAATLINSRINELSYGP